MPDSEPATGATAPQDSILEEEVDPNYVPTEDEIIETARANLASYQKPRSVEFIDELPKAPTGKILKRVLRDPYWADEERDV